MMEDVVFAGLGTGYLVYLLTFSDAAPVWWKRWQFWWLHTKLGNAWSGKPFACSICMSFWLGLLFTIVLETRSWFVFLWIDPQDWIYEVYLQVARFGLHVFAVTAIAFILTLLMDRLSITFIK